MASSNLSDPQLAPPQLVREDKDAVDRLSRGSESSAPSMVEDHGSVTSVDDDQYYRTSGEQIWDTFWQSGCEEDEEVQATVSPSYQYPALVTSSLNLNTRQPLASHKRPTQTQSLGAIEAPAYAKSRSTAHGRTRAERRHGVNHSSVSYSIFPPQDSSEMTRQKTIKARRRPSKLTLEAPKPRAASEGSPRGALRSSVSARNLRSGSASSAFSANSSFSSTTSDYSVAESDHTTVTTPAASPRVSWDCPRTPKPTHVSQCLDFTKVASNPPAFPSIWKAAKQPSLPNLRAPPRYQPAVVQPRSATAEDFAAGEARNARVVAAVTTAEPYPRPLFAPPVVVKPMKPARRAPLPPVSQRLPPPVLATRPIPPPLTFSRPLPPLPLSQSSSRLQTPLSAPPRPQRPEHAYNFGPALSPPRPAGPPRAISQPLPGSSQHSQQVDFKPPVMSVFEWDSDPESDSEAAAGSHNNSANSFAKRIARGFAQIQARSSSHHKDSSSKRAATACGSRGSEELTRIHSGETVTQFRPQRPSRQRALTVEDVRRVEEDMDDRLKLARERVARERSSNEGVVAFAQQPPPPPPAKAPKKEKSAIFGRMLGWRTQ